ncbi:MAG TPA: lysophospholipid acyltransferase family protein [Steroidobacteraceae bacterium]|jgi:KDO2-lipid IV(A) lauroyltransferase|nr:lysophospholipid acyltransferase family protein [Steroidobacteraceae bacterium]
MTQQSEIQVAASEHGRSALWIRALSRLPFGALYQLTALIMWLLRHVFRFRVAVARDNLRRCFPDRSESDIDALLDHYYRQLAQVAAEFIKMADLSADQLRSHLQVHNVERVTAETGAGRSVLLLGAHQCNWEWTLQATVLYLGVPIEAAYKPLHAAGFDRELRTLRCRYGAHLIAAKKLVREVVRRRGQLHAVALHADQMPSSSGRRQWLNFLGRDTAFYPGPAEIARLTGYAAFFVPMRRLSRGQYQLDFLPICVAGERLDPELFTARYAGLVEAMIRENPADWTWVHRRWKNSRPPEASGEPAAPG